MFSGENGHIDALEVLRSPRRNEIVSIARESGARIEVIITTTIYH